MTRYVMVLHSSQDRERAKRYVIKAPPGTRLEFKATKRTPPQNARMWAMLTDVSEQLRWHGRRLRPNQWKLVFMAALNAELDLVPNIDGTGFVSIGQSSSDLSKEEMSDLMEVMAKFGAEHGIMFNDGMLPPAGPEG